MSPAPLVGLPSDRKQIGHHAFQAVGEKYLRAVVDGADCLPLMIPSLTPPLDLRDLLSRLDGLLLTGAYSNIEPHHYSDEASFDGNEHDPARDATTLSIVPLAIEMRVPVLAVCRGLQEVNVALGAKPGRVSRDPEESLLYVSTIYNDPVVLRYDPPMVLGPNLNQKDRSITFCALYDNGFTNPAEVKRQSTSPDPPVEFPGIGGPCAVA